MIFSERKGRNAVVSLLEKFQNTHDLDLSEIKTLLEGVHSLLIHDVDSDYNLCLKAICLIADSPPTDQLLRQLLFECIIQSRVFMYEYMLDATFRNGLYDSLNNDVCIENYTLSKSGALLTKDQKKIYDLFFLRRRIIISAPTSFGKSRIIEEIIINADYNNIIIVLPTIALLSETFHRFKTKPQIVEKYRLINTLGDNEHRYSDNGNLFILTPEKTEVLLDSHDYLVFDFFVMDEVYKINDIDDERSKIFTNCLYRLSKIDKIDYYLLGPYFGGFSEIFLQKTNGYFKKFTSEIVQKVFLDIDGIESSKKYHVNGAEIKKTKDLSKNLKYLIDVLGGQTLVYRGQKKYYTEKTAKKIAESRDLLDSSSELVEYIKDNIAAEWSLVFCLERGVAFHHGALPKYLQTEIMDAFNNCAIKIVVCTSTIIEGVNTSAKNVVIYDNWKGEKPLSGFDVKNIKGRSGRLTKHFIGNVYGLVPITEEDEKGIISFSYYDEPDLDNEDVVQIELEDLAGANSTRRNEIDDNLKKRSIPIELIRNNRYIPVHKQVSLIEKLRSDLFLLDELYFDGALPDKGQLDRIMEICHEYLFSVKALLSGYKLNNNNWLELSCPSEWDLMPLST